MFSTNKTGNRFNARSSIPHRMGYLGGIVLIIKEREATAKPVVVWTGW